jgi:amidophosphoribosyltransferase
MNAVGAAKESYCRACFSGGYPVKFPMLASEPQLGLFETE